MKIICDVCGGTWKDGDGHAESEYLGMKFIACPTVDPTTIRIGDIRVVNVGTEPVAR